MSMNGTAVRPITFSDLSTPCLHPLLLDYPSPVLWKRYRSPWPSAISVSVPSTANIPFSYYLLIKMDWNWAFLLSGIVISPKMAKLIINNILITPQSPVVNTGI